VHDGTLQVTFDHDGWGGDSVVKDVSGPELTGIEASGSGDLDVRADARLDVAVDGSGDVNYHGTPVVTERVDGSGDLSHAG
jgi:hypothetical protein